jgi:hypothetical protein
MNETFVRTYKAKHQSTAIKQALAEAQAENLTIVNQSWQEGRSGCLRLILMGFIFALIIKPKGELTVTFKPA